jgi:hypothetical protein
MDLLGPSELLRAWAGMVLLSAPKEASIRVPLADPDEDRAAFCRGIQDAYRDADAFQPSDAAFVAAAGRVLKRGLGRLFPGDQP